MSVESDKLIFLRNNFLNIWLETATLPSPWTTQCIQLIRTAREWNCAPIWPLCSPVTPRSTSQLHRVAYSIRQVKTWKMAVSSSLHSASQWRNFTFWAPRQEFLVGPSSVPFLPSLPPPFSSFPLPSPPLFSLSSPPLPLEVGPLPFPPLRSRPLNPARGSRGAL